MRITKSTITGLALCLSLAGCSTLTSADRAESVSAPTIGGQAEPAADQGDDAFDSDEGELSGGSTGGVVTFGSSGATAGRDLARTASIILEVADVEQIAQRVTAAAERAGGFVSAANVRGGDFGYGVMTLRVPAANLDSTIVDLGDLGIRVVESSISTEDLTDQLTDLAARIENLELLERELQGLLSEVQNTDPKANQLLQVFERLAEVRGQIEQLEAQREGASRRVALATINVELIPTSIAPDAEEVEPDTTLGQAWASTQEAFEAIGAALIWFGVTILPVGLVVVGVPAFILYLLVRTASRRRAMRIAAAPAPPASPPAHGPPTTVPVAAGAESGGDGGGDDDGAGGASGSG